jgi:hypothetical protein
MTTHIEQKEIVNSEKLSNDWRNVLAALLTIQISAQIQRHTRRPRHGRCAATLRRRCKESLAIDSSGSGAAGGEEKHAMVAVVGNCQKKYVTTRGQHATRNIPFEQHDSDHKLTVEPSTSIHR